MNIDDILECAEHGEYTEHEQDIVGIESGCPICFQIECEIDREEHRYN